MHQTNKQRVLLLEAWRDFEVKHGDAASQESLRRKMPRKIKKRRKITSDDGVRVGGVSVARVPC